MWQTSSGPEKPFTSQALCWRFRVTCIIVLCLRVVVVSEVSPAAELAVATLAEELGCAPGEIIVVEVAPVTWRNSALGCPQPGMMYLQVLTPGFRVRLRQADQEYVIHTDRGRHAVHCPPDQREDGLPPE
jgi:hypothetical protein